MESKAENKDHDEGDTTKNKPETRAERFALGERAGANAANDPNHAPVSVCLSFVTDQLTRCVRHRARCLAPLSWPVCLRVCALLLVRAQPPPPLPFVRDLTGASNSNSPAPACPGQAITAVSAAITTTNNNHTHRVSPRATARAFVGLPVPAIVFEVRKCAQSRPQTARPLPAHAPQVSIVSIVTIDIIIITIVFAFAFLAARLHRRAAS